MIKAELLEVDFEEDTMTFKCLDPIVAKKGNYVLLEEKEFEKLSIPSGIVVEHGKVTICKPYIRNKESNI